MSHLWGLGLTVSGDFHKINIAHDDAGGQLDSSEHTPSGAQLLLGADKSPADNWVVSRKPTIRSMLTNQTIIGNETFCVRACTGDPQYVSSLPIQYRAEIRYCPTQYDTLGCYFLTNDGVGWPGAFQDCEGEDGRVPGVDEHGQTYTPVRFSQTLGHGLMYRGKVLHQRLP